jgi:hypothetical protein
MARDLIDVQYPTVDATQSVGAVKVTKTTVTPANGIGIKKAFANKNNTLSICVENNDDAATYITFKAGDAYPNAMLGDLKVDLLAETANVFQVQDISRFENKDGSLNIDFASGFDGTIYAVAKAVKLNA